MGESIHSWLTKSVRWNLSKSWIGLKSCKNPMEIPSTINWVSPASTPKSKKLVLFTVYMIKNWTSLFQHCTDDLMFNLYHSLSIEHPWAEHLTSLPKRWVIALSTVSAFNQERAPTSCLQWLEPLEANNWTQNNVQRNHQCLRSWVLTAHNTLNGTMWWWA